MSHIKTLHLRYAIDAKNNQSLTLQQFCRLTPNEQSSLQSNFRQHYPMAGTTDEDAILMPFCRRGVTLAQLEQELKDKKSKIAQATKKVLHAQQYYGKGYKEIFD